MEMLRQCHQAGPGILGNGLLHAVMNQADGGFGVNGNGRGTPSLEDRNGGDFRDQLLRFFAESLVSADENRGDPVISGEHGVQHELAGIFAVDFNVLVA